MLVPLWILRFICIVNLYIADIGLGQSPRQQTLPAKVLGLFLINPVALEGRRRFSRQVHNVRRLHLHSVGQFIRLDRRLQAVVIVETLGFFQLQPIQALP